jgi:putative transposase
MTGIQALERAERTRFMKPGRVELQEFEYIRHGTQCLIANWHVALGKVIASLWEKLFDLLEVAW